MRRGLLGTLLVLVLGAGTAFGQDPPTPPTPPTPPGPPPKPMRGDPHGPNPEQHKELRKKIQAMRMARLTQELDLDEAAAAKLFPLINRHDEKVNGLMEDRGRIMHGLAEAVHEGKTDAFGGLLDKLAETEKALHEADETTHKKVREALTPAQAAKFFLFHEKFHDEVRELLDDARRDDKIRDEKMARAKAEAMRGEKGEKGPAHLKGLLEKAQMCLKQGQLEDAEKILAMAIEAEPKNPGAYLMRAQVRAQRARLDEALDDAKRAMEIDPKSPDPHAVGAHILIAKKELKLARAQADWIVENDPRSAQGWMLRAMISLSAGKFDEALSDVTRAIELNPTEAQAFRLRAEVREHTGDPQGAIEDYKRFIEMNPKGVEVERVKKKMENLAPK